MHRLALVASHPIQYQAPWFRALAKVTDLEVFYCHQQDAAGQAAAGFGVAFEWDVPLLDGYSSSWLNNVARRPDVSTFSGCDTPDVADRLARGHFDACIVSGWYLKSYLQAIWACKRHHIPVLSRGDSQLGTSRSAAWTLAKYWPYRWLLGAIDAHLYVGAANREYLAHYGVPAARLFFTPHFVDNAFFATRAEAARERSEDKAIRRSLSIDETTMVFAFVGKLIDKKRPADLLRALAQSKSDRSACALIIGSGPLQPELERLAADLAVSVRFAGFKNQTELPAFLTAADALVPPSDGRETWGLVVNEAMACALPAVVSDAAGCSRDLIEPGRTGYRFPVGDIDALADALMTLDHTLARDRSRMRAAVESKISRYTSDAAVDGTLDAIDAVVASERQSAKRRPLSARTG